VARIAYEKWTPRGDALDMVAKANAVCADYRQQGYDLTLRQLYYQFVARGWIPNSQRSYKRLGDVVNKARMAGLMDWDYIVDRTRNVQTLGHWSSPASIIRGAANSYARDKWSDQPTRVEVWVEKEALAGVVEQVAERHDVSYFSCRGYVSQSEQWGAAQRLGRYIEAGQNVVILHLGDHDPSGIDMTRDIRERIGTFLTQDYLNRHVSDFEGDSVLTSKIWDAMAERTSATFPFVVERIALNMDQIEEYEPPPNPAKTTDSRFESYEAEYGEESWELDALDPSTLDALIEEHVLDLRDDVLYFEQEAIEERHRILLTETSNRWTDVVDFLTEPDEDDDDPEVVEDE
jgi:hypothetical protein